MAETITLAVDALGGDNAPKVVLEGCTQALREDSQLQIVLCGPRDVVEPFAAEHERCRAQVTTQEIAMGDHPAEAVRKKKDSSLVVGCRLVKEGQAQGFFSAGSTGACLAAGTFVMGRVGSGVRPALCTVLPSPVSPVILCDVGANADCKPEHIVQFAQMAVIYAREVIGIKEPRVGLLNIGEEESKGSKFALECYELLSKELPNFVGNCEGNEILKASFDVVVTDGFTGNVCLKALEGTTSILFSTLKEVMLSSTKAKLGALALKGPLMSLKKSLSAETYGGAPLLGVKGACIVGHGSSSALAITNGIHTTARVVRGGVVELIEQAVSK